MTIYFQHVGERLGQRDFPKTLGAPSSGLRLFHFNDIEPFLNDISDNEKDELRLRIHDFAPDGFQIWEYRRELSAYFATWLQEITFSCLRPQVLAGTSPMLAL
jgi:hypothetical protein